LRTPRLAPWLLPAVPAALAGTQLAGLLLFLNPELPVSLPTLARLAGYYTLLFAPFAVALHVAIARWRRVLVERLLPWSLTVVAALAALGDGMHASLYAYLLPEAINVQLIKAALWLTLAAVLLFYTALLHTLHHRRYGPRSRLLVAVAAIGSVYAMLDRRTSYREPRLEAPPISLGAEIEAPRLVVVALPAATLDAMLPLARQGKLPFVARLLETGASARLGIFPPPRRAALWTSWATGKLPFRHGIVGARRWSAPLLGSRARVALLPLAPAFADWGLAGGVPHEPTLFDRRALTAWEIVGRLGRRAEAFGFAPWLGGGATIAVPPATGRSLGERALAALGRGGLARRLRIDRSALAAARALVEQEPPAALFIELDGLEQASLDTYGGFAAVTFEGARATALTRAARAYEIYLAGLDSELELLWRSLPEPRVLAISSPYGVSPPQGLDRAERFLLNRDRGPRGALSTTSDGLLLLRGDGIRAAVQIAGARSVDVVPTLLYAAALPLARDFDGRVLAELFDPATLQRRALSFVPSFEGLPPGQ
jgi:hypothetical protein